MVNLYIWGKRPLLPIKERSIVISNIKKVLRVFRKKQIPVIYINSAFKKSHPIFKVIGHREQVMENTKGAGVISELKPHPNDYQLKKSGYDGFWKSGLEKLLKKLRVQEIYITGCQTDCCVRETGVTAAHLGYKVNIIEDCCATNRPWGQKAAMRFMKTCVGNIVQSDKLNP